MPPLTRWHIKTALLFFVAALLLGILQALKPFFTLPTFVYTAGPVYVHLLTVGWITQLIMGMAYWMFPVYSREHKRGSEKLGWAAYGLLTIGLLLRVVGEPLHTASPHLGLGWMVALSAVLQWLAGLAFVGNTWGRVKER